MTKEERKEKLENYIRLTESPEWKIYIKDMEEVLRLKEGDVELLHQQNKLVEANYQMGIKKGIKFSIAFPNSVIRQNMGFFERLKEMVTEE